MVFKKFGIDPAAASKTIGNVMPIRDAGFAKAPAEIDFFIAIEGWKIHQAGVEVLDLAADFLHSFKGRFQIARGGVFAPTEQLRLVARWDHSAGQSDPLRDAIQLRIGFLVLLFRSDQTADEPLYLWQGALGFDQVEKFRHRQSSITAE